MMILVVDDHPINRRLLADQLGSLGYQCKTANDGVDALNVLSKNAIDIVLSDVNMPNMDGYRLTQRIRQLGLTLPVVGVTANALAEEKQRCLESGMDSCLSKPVTLDVLKQTLAVYAERVRKRGHKKCRMAALPVRLAKDESTGRPDKRSAIRLGNVKAIYSLSVGLRVTEER